MFNCYVLAKDKLQCPLSRARINHRNNRKLIKSMDAKTLKSMIEKLHNTPNCANFYLLNLKYFNNNVLIS